MISVMQEIECPDCLRFLGRFVRGELELATFLKPAGGQRRKYVPASRDRGGPRLVMATSGPVTIVCRCRRETVVEVA